MSENVTQSTNQYSRFPHAAGRAPHAVTCKPVDTNTHVTHTHVQAMHVRAYTPLWYSGRNSPLDSSHAGTSFRPPQLSYMRTRIAA